MLPNLLITLATFVLDLWAHFERNTLWKAGVQMIVRSSTSRLFQMGISKTEINLKRLLVSARNQHNQAKLIHYITTLREQLEVLGEEKTSDGLPRVSKAQLNDYSERIEVIASKLSVSEPAIQESDEPSSLTCVVESSSRSPDDSPTLASPRLRRRFVPQSHRENRIANTVKPDRTSAVKLDSASLTHIEKHRKLQDDLTDEMVSLAQQLKESSLTMSQSLQNTEKILDSTEKAVENSLASTGHETNRAMDIYSKTSKTTCFTWLLMFTMTCIFIMVVLLIRVT